MNSIRNRLLLAIVISGLLPIAIVFVLTRTIIESSHLKSQEESLSEINHELANQVAASMESAATDLRSLTNNPFFTNYKDNVSAVREEMQRLVSVYDRFLDISVYDADGYLICVTSDAEVSEPLYKDYSASFKQALAGRTSISPPKIILGQNGLYLTVYLPMLVDDKPGSGVIKARLSFDRVLGVLGNSQIGQNGFTIMLDKWGNIISGPDEKSLFQKFDDRYPIDHWQENGAGEYFNPAGMGYIYTSEILSDQETMVGSAWTLIAFKPLEEVNAFLDQTRLLLLLTISLTMGLALILTFVTSKVFASPIERASAASQALAAGQMTARLPISGPVEMRKLARSFNQMAAELSQHRSELENLVTARTESLRRSQKELERTTAQLRASFESSRDGVLIVGGNRRVIAANQLFQEYFGLEERDARGVSLDYLVERVSHCFVSDDECDEVFGRKIHSGDVSMSELEFDILSPKSRNLSVYDAPVITPGGEMVGRIWMFRDLTERRALEENLRHAQKMEAVGQLAGGVAHDFNNLLTGIMGNLALVEMDLEGAQSDAQRRYLRLAAQAGQRAAELIKQLLGFSRRSHLRLEPCNANLVLEQATDLLEATIDPKVRLELDLDPEPFTVVVDPNQLEQVVMNMCVNAKDAMPMGGRITLRTRNITIDETKARTLAEGKMGDYLCVSVIDTGAGMSAEVKAKIFEPFFTTKEQGKGTGLGLATSYGIVRQLDGWIECESEPGKGTEFRIFLPRRSMALPQPKEEKKTVMAQSECHETVLLVDDEVIVRNVAESLLTRLGYKVLTAGDGNEALQIYNRAPSIIDLVMLDLTMPNLSGKETFRILREKNPDIRVLICSGYLVDLNAFQEETGSRPDGFVQKPYNLDAMAEAVREVLDTRSAAA